MSAFGVQVAGESGPPAGQAGSRRRRRIVLFGAVILLVSVAAAFLYVRPDLPRRTELTAVMELVATGQVADLSVVDESLIVTRRNGEQQRVDHLGDAQVQPLFASAIAWAQANPGRPIMMRKDGGDTLPSQLPILATSLLPLIVVLLLAGLLLRTLRRRRRSRG